MKLTGNTIFITGGGSGIGRGLAEALHNLGNKVIISGRNINKLEKTIQANPGMSAVELDIENPASITSVSEKLIQEYPDLNVLFNNAGIMLLDEADGIVDDSVLTSTITTNLEGPIRMTSALIEHLKSKEEAAIIYTTSALAFVPMAVTAIYSSTKAALHSYALSQRFLLKETSVRVLELAPPWVQTDLFNSNDEPRAMPLGAFIESAMNILGTDADEIIVEEAQFFRGNPGPNEAELVNHFNQLIKETPPMTH